MTQRVSSYNPCASSFVNAKMNFPRIFPASVESYTLRMIYDFRCSYYLVCFVVIQAVLLCDRVKV